MGKGKNKGLQIYSKYVCIQGSFHISPSGAVFMARCLICEVEPTDYHGPAIHRLDRERILRHQLKELEGREDKESKRAHKRITKMLSGGLDDNANELIVSPNVYAARAKGMQSIACPECGQIGIIMFEKKRNKPIHATGMSMSIPKKAANTDPTEHIRRRPLLTYIALRALRTLAETGQITAGVSLYCGQASVQMVPLGGGVQTTPAELEAAVTKDEVLALKYRGKQDAHQILRELVVGGRLIWDLDQRGAVEKYKEAMIYCHAMVSNIATVWNTCDGLIEMDIEDDFIGLARRVIYGRDEVDEGYCRGLWFEILAMYAGAIAKANARADKIAVVAMADYARIAATMRSEEIPLWLLGDTPSLFAWCLKDVSAIPKKDKGGK